METFLEHVNTLLEQVLTQMTSGSGVYIGSAKIIAGIGAIILSGMTYSQIVNGKLEESVTSFLKRLLPVSYTHLTLPTTPYV